MTQDHQYYEARREARWREVVWAGFAEMNLFSAGAFLGHGNLASGLVMASVAATSAGMSVMSRSDRMAKERQARLPEERHAQQGEANARQDERLGELEKRIAELAGNAPDTSVSSSPFHLSADPGRRGGGATSRMSRGQALER